MDYQDSYGCRECSNGHNLRALRGPGFRCARRPRTASRSGLFPRHATLVSVGGGITAGIALSIGLHSVLARWAEGNTLDPVILLVGIVMLGLVSGLACTLPARHATRVDPKIGRAHV